MTLLTRRTSTTARRRRSLAPLLAAVVMLSGLVGALCAPDAAAALAVSGAHGVAAAQGAGASQDVKAAKGDDLEPSLDLRLPDNGLVDGEFTATVAIDNPTDGNPLTAEVGDTIPAGRVVLERGRDPFGSQRSLERWLDGRSDPEVVQIGSVGTDELTPGSNAEVKITVDLSRQDAGAYPIRARFVPSTGGDVDLADTAVLTNAADDDPKITLVVPITAPASSRGLLTAEQLEAMTSPSGALTNELAAVKGTAAALAIDPAIPAAIRVLGDDAPSSATAWLDELMSLPNDRFALQFGDADVATQVADGEGPFLAPSSLAPYIAGAGDVEAAGTGTTDDEPSPTTSPDADPVELNMEELLDVGRTVGDIFWPDPDIAGSETLAGIEERDGAALLPSTAAKAGADGSTVRARADHALIYDADLSGDLSDAAAIEDDHDRSVALEKAIASMWIASDDVSGANLLVTLDRPGGVISAERGDDDSLKPAKRPAEAIADVVETVDDVSGTSLRSLLSSKAHKASFAPASEPLRTGMSDELAEDEGRLADLGSVLADPELLTGRTRAEELQLLAVNWARHPDAWEASFEAHKESLVALENAVGLVPPSDVNLLSSEAPLPVWVRNDLPYPITVTLFSYPDDVRLKMETSTVVEAPASSNTRVQLPVEATLGSGDVTIRLSIESPTGVTIGDGQTMHVTVRADWERYGIAGLVGLIVLLIVAGTIRTIRRRSSRAARDDAEPAGEAAAAPVDADEEQGPGDADAPADEDGDGSHEEEEDIDGKSR